MTAKGSEWITLIPIVFHIPNISQSYTWLGYKIKGTNIKDLYFETVVTLHIPKNYFDPLIHSRDIAIQGVW